MPVTIAQSGLFSKSSKKAEPMLPDEPITSARKGVGSKGVLIKRLVCQPVY